MEILLAVIGVAALAYFGWRIYASRNPRQVILRIVMETFTDGMNGVELTDALEKASARFRLQKALPISIEQYVLGICHRAHQFGLDVELGNLPYLRAVNAINLNVNTVAAMSETFRADPRVGHSLITSTKKDAVRLLLRACFEKALHLPADQWTPRHARLAVQEEFGKALSASSLVTLQEIADEVVRLGYRTATPLSGPYRWQPEFDALVERAHASLERER